MSITEERAWALIREARRARDKGFNSMTITQREARALRISRLPGDGDCTVALWAVELAITAQAERTGWQIGLLPIEGNVRAAFEQIERLRALTTITDDMVRKAAEALGDSVSLTLGAESLATNPDTVGVLHDDARAILEAALNPPA